MSALSIQVPFPVFQDRDGQPLDNGYVWLGTSSLNPQTNPVVAYYDSALTIVATQPLRTINGFISRAGSPAQVYVDAVNFSVLVQDRQGTTVFSVPEGTGISPNASGVVYDPVGTGAVATTVQAKLRLILNVKDFGAVADWNGATGTDNAAAINAAYTAAKTNGSGTILIPRGDYYCSTLVGSDPNNATDWANNVSFIGEHGTNLIFSGAYAGGTCLGLQGDHIAIRNISVNSTRTLDYRSPLIPQRTPYQLGIYIGGKQTLVDLDSYSTDVEVSGCIVQNMNLPIVLQASSNIRCLGNTVDQFTDTGIIVNDCTTDIWVLNNKVTRGGDDCFFARVNPGSFYSALGAFCGRIFVQDNMFHDTFGKNAGFGGYGSIIFSGNYCSLNWAGGVNLENTWGDMLNPFNYSEVLIDNNTFINSGRNWGSSITDPAHQVPAAGDSPSGIQTVYANGPATYLYKNISLTNNKIINPYQSCVALYKVTDILISGNTFTPGATNHGAGVVNSLGLGVNAYAIERLTISGNSFNQSLGNIFSYCYAFATSTGPISDVSVFGNLDLYSAGPVAFSDGGAATATNYGGFDVVLGGLRANLANFTYANLPAAASTAAYTGSVAYCTDGRKVWEGAGAGTGVPVYFAGGVWRVFSADTAVAI